MEDIYMVTITKLDGKVMYFSNINSYTYDRDFIRLHGIDDFSKHKNIVVFPTNNILSFEVEFSKGGENNA